MRACKIRSGIGVLLFFWLTFSSFFFCLLFLHTFLVSHDGCPFTFVRVHYGASVLSSSSSSSSCSYLYYFFSSSLVVTIFFRLSSLAAERFPKLHFSFLFFNKTSRSSRRERSDTVTMLLDISGVLNIHSTCTYLSTLHICICKIDTGMCVSVSSGKLFGSLLLYMCKAARYLLRFFGIGNEASGLRILC